MNILEIAAPTLEWMKLAPILTVLVGAILGVLVEAALPREARYGVQVVIGFGSLALSLFFVIFNWLEGDFGLAAVDSLALDGPTYVLWSALLVFSALGMMLFAERRLTGGKSTFVASGATVPGSPLEREAEALRFEHTEVFPLMLFAVSGMLLFPAANDLLMMFIALEIFSLPLYLLAGLARRRRLLSQEAALKYFLLGALSSAILLFGVAMLYGYSGSFTLGDIDAAITANTQNWVLLVSGMTLVTVGLLFKIGAVPFHSWTPDVYTGSPTPVTAFMAVATKIAATGALVRFLYVAVGAARWDWQLVIAFVAVLTMAVGSLVAIAQSDIKRMLAYSSIAHAGFILVGVTGALMPLSFDGIAFYLIAYGFATLGAFAIVTMVRRAGGEANSLQSWAGLGRTNPVLAGTFTLFLLSFAGIPLTAGFIGKWMVFVSAWAGGFAWLVVVAVLMSLVAAFFYLRVIMVMFFTEPAEDAAEVVYPSALTWIVISVGAAATLVLGLVPGPLLDVIVQAGGFLR